MPTFPRQRPFATLAPDSGRAGSPSPATRRFDLTEKRDALPASDGVAHLWLVDPEARTLEAFTLAAGAWILAAAFQDGDDSPRRPFEPAAISSPPSGPTASQP